MADFTSSQHPFERLSPAAVVNAVESLGLWLPGEPFALNSYENRVFMLSDDERRRWVAKFYRPGRWSDAQIQEEHDFLIELDTAGVPVSVPWRDAEGNTFHRWEGFRLALFAHIGGQAPELENPQHLFALGELIGRAHKVAVARPFKTRRVMDLDGMVAESRVAVLAGPWLNRRQQLAYARISEELHQQLQAHAWPADTAIRLHGDCHLGNMLGRDDDFSLVDFDDALMGPRVQDIWMLLTAQGPEEAQWQLSEVLEGYEQAAEFPREELALIEPLRTLRLMRHSAWLTARWEDPAFPRAFPWAADENYWDQHIRSLEQQRQVLDKHPRWLAGY